MTADVLPFVPRNGSSGASRRRSLRNLSPQKGRTVITNNTASQRRVYEALESHDCRPRGTAALCPGHDDHDPSLAIGYGEENGVGKVLLTCHAGCELQAIVDALGLELTDLFDEDKPDFAHSSPRYFLSVSPGSLNNDGDLSTHHPTVAVLKPKPTPKPTGRVPIDTGDTDAVHWLLKSVRDAETGANPPDWQIPLRLDRLPHNAYVLRAVAEKVALIMAVRLTYGELEAAPLAGSLIARAMGWHDADAEGACRGRKVLRAICNCEVLRFAESLPPRGWPYGTKCYQPRDFDLVDFWESNGVLLQAVGEQVAA